MTYGPPAPVPIIQWEDEFTQILDLYRARKPRTVLEVGTAEGGTLYHWLQNATPDALVVAVDLHHPNEDMYPDWIGEGVALHTVTGDSRHPATVAQVKTWAPYDWVFIDAGHLLFEVWADWKLYGSLVRPGGIVAFHDINPADDPDIEVDELWAKLRERHETTEILGGHEGGGIGIVHA